MLVDTNAAVSTMLSRTREPLMQTFFQTYLESSKYGKGDQRVFVLQSKQETVS